MERERITISIRKKVLNSVDRTIDGMDIRNRSHAIESLIAKALEQDVMNNAVILVGGEDALSAVPQVKDNLKKLKASGLESVYMAVGFLAPEIKEKIGESSYNGVDLEYIESKDGSAGALLPLKGEYSGTFLIINNIDIKKLNIEELIDTHKRSDAKVTVITDDLSSLSGLYICEPDIFSYIGKGFSMLETDVFSKLMSDKKLIIRPI